MFWKGDPLKRPQNLKDKKTLFYLTFFQILFRLLAYIKSKWKINSYFLAFLTNLNFSLLSRLSITVRIAPTANVWSKNWLHHFDNAKRPLSSRTSALCPSAPYPPALNQVQPKGGPTAYSRCRWAFF